MAKKKKKERIAFEKPTFDNPFAALDLELPEADEPAVEPSDKRAEPAVAEKAQKAGAVRLHKERKQRGGKTVTVVSGLDALTDTERDEMLALLKRKLGVGAFLEEKNIVLQGDVAERAIPLLKKLGFKDVK